MTGVVSWREANKILDLVSQLADEDSEDYERGVLDTLVTVLDSLFPENMQYENKVRLVRLATLAAKSPVTPHHDDWENPFDFLAGSFEVFQDGEPVKVDVHVELRSGKWIGRYVTGAGYSGGTVCMVNYGEDRLTVNDRDRQSLVTLIAKTIAVEWAKANIGLES